VAAVILGAVRMYLVGPSGLVSGPGASEDHAWSEAELKAIDSLRLARLDVSAVDPSNSVFESRAAAELGHQVFFDTSFSATGAVSCATCHQPERMFTDGLPRSQAIGETDRNAPTIVGAAHQRWFFWDGRKDSLWSQALGPLENPNEHGGNRTRLARTFLESYGEQYRRVFGEPPDFSDSSRFPQDAGPEGSAAERRAWADMRPEDRGAVNRVFASLGKAVAAYERQLRPAESPFDLYADAALAGDSATMRTLFLPSQVGGLRVFIGSGQCTQCHNGSRFTNDDFHNVAIPPLPPGGTHVDVKQLSGVVEPGIDAGRATGAFAALDDAFNCLGEYSDAGGDCPELRFIRRDPHALGGAFKTPSLRNVAETAPYMHDGSLATLRDVILHYAEQPDALVGHSEIPQFQLTETEALQLEAFLGALTGGVDAETVWLSPPH
jgi:cytochrome c peroxidase